MSGQTVRWGLGFVATTGLAAALLVAGATAPPVPAVETVARRDLSKVSDVELELMLNKIREGDLLSRKGDAAGGRRTWEEARRMGEGLWPIHEGLGDSYARARLFEDALREYRTAEPLVADKHAALRAGIAVKRATTLAAAGRPLEGLQACLDLNQPGALGPRILDLALRCDSAAAVQAIARHAEVYDARLFQVLSVFHAKQDRKAESAEALGQFVVRVAPWDENLNRQAIDGLQAARRFDAAVAVCRAWVKAVPQAIEAYRRMGDVLWDAGREREALVAYSSIVDVRPNDAEAHRMLGDLYRARNRIDDAIAQYMAAKKARPEDVATYTTLSQLYEAKGDGAKAEEATLEAVQRFGTGNIALRGRLVATALDRIEKAKAAGKADEVRALREKYEAAGLAEAGLFDLKVIMTWDAKTHVDLDVVEPGGETVNHEHETSKAGGRYYMHNTEGQGPETYTLKKAPAGTYRIGCHQHDAGRSTVKFTLILYEGTPREERREGSLIMEKDGEQKFIPDLVLP